MAERATGPSPRPQSSESLAATAAAVRSGQRLATDVVEVALERIAAHDPEIAAFLTVTPELARAGAAAVDAEVGAGRDPGPLAGIPVAIKDNICTRGIATSCGSKILDGWVPPYDATVITRLREAGAVIVGKTNLDEFAMGSSTENSAFRPTRNPVDTSRIPGGSSGGSAAAVAAGMVPVALGSDTGGSIRQPAAMCGVVGIKPTYGRVSRYGLVAYGSSLDQIGPITRSVEDAALVLSVIGGPDRSDSTSILDAFDLSSGEPDKGASGLRVGLISNLLGDGTDSEVSSAVRALAAGLADGGATVEEVSLPSLEYALSAYYVIAPAEASSNLARYDGVRYGNRVEAASAAEMMVATRTAGFGDEVKRRIMLGTYALSAGYYDAFYGKAQKVRTLLRDDLDRAFENFDVLLSPTSPCTAWRFGDKDDPLTMYLADVCTIPSNLAGHPSGSVPCGFDSDGLPIGAHFMAPALGEATLIRAMRAAEAQSAPTERRSAGRPGAGGVTATGGAR